MQHRPGGRREAMDELPIFEIQSTLVELLAQGNRAIVTAPTGSGKSTQVPQILLDTCGMPGRLLVLQPRRLAARMLAERVSAERREPLGQTVGFITRFERAVSPATRICFITEGVLLRLLLQDRQLRGVSAVVFDEFHERNLAGDIGLAVTKQVQESTRSDLKVVIMSATLAVDVLQRYLESCPLLQTEGRAHPVDISYLSKPSRAELWDVASLSVQQVLSGSAEGDLLVFMPGAYEIRRTIEACRRVRSPARVTFMPLYGDLPPRLQGQVMAAASARKVVVATNIAETSLTIPGVRHVIDSGFARVNRYDTGRAFNMLVLEPISRASADQRSGRAGREAPGTCRRLWTLAEQQRRHAYTDPEVQRVDLAEALLVLTSLGYRDLHAFDWVERPSDVAVESATLLLVTLGALEATDLALTDKGRELARIPAHPRLAVLMRDAARRGRLEEGAMVAAILSERPMAVTARGGRSTLRDSVDNVLPEDTSRSPSTPTPTARSSIRSDFFALMNALRQAHAARFESGVCARLGIHGSAAGQVWRTYELLLRVGRRLELGADMATGSGEEVARSLLRAFPDRLARRRDRGTLLCDLRDGRRAELARASTVRDADLLVAAEIREVGGRQERTHPLLTLVTEVREEWLRDEFPEQWQTVEETVWDERTRQVLRRRCVSCLGVVLEQTVSPAVDLEQAAAILAERVKSGELKLRGLTQEVDLWLDRVRWVREVFPERGLIAYDEMDMDVILREVCAGATRYKQIKDRPCLDLVRHALSWDDQQFVETMAPPCVRLPGGMKMRLSYKPGQAARGRARIQDLYDLQETPRVADGRNGVLIDILAPNMRTFQVTEDMAGFWRNTYPKAKKELARRYPKHEWR